MDIWTVASIVAKFGLYAGVFGPTGTVLALLIFRNELAPLAMHAKRRALGFALVGLLAAFGGFLLRSAALTGDASGLIDAEMWQLLWETPVGDALIFRGAGLALLVLGLTMPKSKGNLIALLGGAMAVWSFTQIGHVPDKGNWMLRALLMLHLVGVSFWVGILWPLKTMVSDRTQILDAALLGDRFGKIATWVVPGLILAGLVMATQLIGSISELISTGYGQVLLCKIALLSALLVIAAMNKLRFVPALQLGKQVAAERLRRAIGSEQLIVALIFIVTAVLTGFVSLP